VTVELTGNLLVATLKWWKDSMLEQSSGMRSAAKLAAI
jgi:hypothetical protein